MAIVAVGLLVGGAGVLWGATGSEEGTIQEALPAENPAGSPEEAAEAYLTAWAGGDWMLATERCATTSFVEGVDQLAVLNRVKAWTPADYLPADEPAFRELNLITRTGRCLSDLRMLTLNAAAPEIGSGVTEPIDDMDAARELESRLDPSQFEGLTIERVDIVASSDGSGRFAEVFAEQLPLYGSSAFVELGALISWEGELYTTGMNAVKYEEGWLIVDAYGSVRALSQGAFSPTTEQAYLDSLEVGRS